MANKELKYSAALERCKKNIEKTKGLIEYHRKMLRIYENKESKLVTKLENEKMAALRRSISDNGYDLDAICTAVAKGDFSRVSSADVSAEPEGKKNEPVSPVKGKKETEVIVNGNDKGTEN